MFVILKIYIKAKPKHLANPQDDLLMQIDAFHRPTTSRKHLQPKANSYDKTTTIDTPEQFYADL